MMKIVDIDVEDIDESIEIIESVYLLPKAL
jgi:hypothetical protein